MNQFTQKFWKQQTTPIQISFNTRFEAVACWSPTKGRERSVQLALPLLTSSKPALIWVQKDLQLSHEWDRVPEEKNQCVG